MSPRNRFLPARVILRGVAVLVAGGRRDLLDGMALSVLGGFTTTRDPEVRQIFPAVTSPRTASGRSFLRCLDALGVYSGDEEEDPTR